MEGVLPQDTASRRLLSACRRFGTAAAGPVGSAVAQFILTLQALHLMTPNAFGSFALLLIAQQFSLGLWNALFCAPLPVLLNEGDDITRQDRVRSLFATNLALAGLVALIFIVVATVLSVADAIIVGAFAGIALLRWFARAHAYAIGKPLKTMSSDLIYCVSLLGGVAVVAWSETTWPGAPYVALLAATCASLLVFGGPYLAKQFVHVALSDLKRYGDVWRRHSRWSLAGVISTEATANAHAYLVTAFAGPTAFAPVAVSALVTRPIGVAMNALSEFERPQMARHVGRSEFDRVMSLVRSTRWMLIGGWVLSAIIFAPVVLLIPTMVFTGKYDPTTLAVGAALWMAVAFVRLLRVPESTALQAAGMFRVLAYASFASSAVSVAAVVGMILACGPLWSIVGVLFGEIVFTLSILLRMHGWSQTMRSNVLRPEEVRS